MYKFSDVLLPCNLPKEFEEKAEEIGKITSSIIKRYMNSFVSQAVEKASLGSDMEFIIDVKLIFEGFKEELSPLFEDQVFDLSEYITICQFMDYSVMKAAQVLNELTKTMFNMAITLIKFAGMSKEVATDMILKSMDTSYDKIIKGDDFH